MAKYDFPTYLINLEDDIERKKSSLDQLHKININPIVVPACNGHQKDFPFHKYRHLSRGKWWDKEVFKPGAFACYLSHAKCWETIASGSAPYAMILEDDMIINQDGFRTLTLDIVPDTFDLIFINQGVTNFLQHISFKDDISSEEKFISLNKVLLDLILHNAFNNLQPGSYGYIISKNGAKKLLKIMEQTKVCMGVDYAMVFNSLKNDDISTIKTHTNIPHYLEIYMDNMRDDTVSSLYKRIHVNSYIYTLPALVKHDYEPESTIQHEIYKNFTIFYENNFLQSKIKKIQNWLLSMKVPK